MVCTPDPPQGGEDGSEEAGVGGGEVYGPYGRDKETMVRQGEDVTHTTGKLYGICPLYPAKAESTAGHKGGMWCEK